MGGAAIAGDQRVSYPGGDIQTYVRRRGRMTPAQARALGGLAERFSVPDTGPLDQQRTFGRVAPLGLEIGFGMGQSLLYWAARRPDWNLLGLEIYQPGIGALMLGLEREELQNVRVIEAPAESVLEHRIEAGSIAEIRIFFPDPWPKKRHHKRRLVQPGFVALLARCLQPGGRLWLATDWEPYADWMLEVLEREPLLRNLAGTGAFAGAAVDSDDTSARPVTRFEARGLRLGHRVWDLRYQRNC